MTCGLPCRGSPDPRQRWQRLLAVAICSRSAQEMLGATLHRTVAARPVRNEVIRVDGPVRSLELPAGPQRLRLLEHLLLDTRCPHRPVGSSLAVVVDERLPARVAAGARRGEAPLDALLERDRDYWAAETTAVEKVGGDVPTVRLARLLYLLGTPVAAVVEEIRLPELCQAAIEDPSLTQRSA